MKILLKKILEKVTLVIFCLVVIFGNILLIYNFNNKFQNINELYEFSDKIDNYKYICIKNINDSEIMINNEIYETDIKIDTYLKELFEI